MDALISAAARALAAGDPLAALDRIALRDDARALALRGIAMAQLGDLPRARALVKSAARAFSPRETLARARCAVAEAEIALACRDLGWPVKKLEAARLILEQHGDRVNAAHARYLQIRRLLLIGRVDDAEVLLNSLDPATLPPVLRAAHEMVLAGIAIRRLHAQAAHHALTRAEQAARLANIPALLAEVEQVALILKAPVARLLTRGTERSLVLADVEALLGSTTLVIDACRFAVRGVGMSVSLATRPVLFALLRTLAEAWPGDVSRQALVAGAFRLELSDDSHRARLRVEIGRLRAALKPLAAVNATPRGYALVALVSHEVAVLAQPVEEKHAAVFALLADGESWASSALALAASGKVQSFGRGRARRWMLPPIPGFATTLLLPAPLPSD